MAEWHTMNFPYDKKFYHDNESCSALNTFSVCFEPAHRVTEGSLVFSEKLKVNAHCVP